MIDSIYKMPDGSYIDLSHVTAVAPLHVWPDDQITGELNVILREDALEVVWATSPTYYTTETDKARDKRQNKVAAAAGANYAAFISAWKKFKNQKPK
jgi:hypothetical protein